MGLKWVRWQKLECTKDLTGHVCVIFNGFYLKLLVFCAREGIIGDCLYYLCDSVPLSLSLSLPLVLLGVWRPLLLLLVHSNHP